MLPLLRWQEHHHPYEAIGRRAQAGARGDREADTSRRRWGSLRAAVLCGAALCSVGLWVAIRSDDGMDGAVSPSSLSRPTELSAVSGETGARIAGRKVGEELGSADALMQVMVTNKYQRDQASLDMPLYPWEHMAEPMRETRMEISSWPERGDRAELDFIWRLEGEVVGTGEAMSTYFESPGTYKCSVSAYLKGDGGKEELPGGSSGGGGGGIDRLDNGRGEEVAAGAWLDRTSGVRLGSARGVGTSGHVGASAGMDTGPGTNRLDFEVTVKYVRREIRSLTDRDRETFFNAMAVMQRVPSAVGRQVYGNKYYSKDYFNRIHLYYGGRKECDHFHAGAGFVTSHVAISLMFEQSLQAIEPSIALPYWDFTVEGTYYDWSNFRTSSIFSDDWFGDAAPKNEMRTPARGRFGFVPVMMNATEYSSVYNSYGMLRSPWNNDPTPYLTRSDHLMGFTNHRKPSGCRRYRETMMQTTWMSLTESFNDAAHGEIHELLGGAWSLEAAAYASKTNPVVQPFVHQAVPLLKMLWRMGYIGCPDTCAMDMPWEECRCSCSAETLNGEPPAEILEVSGVLAAGFFYDKDAVLIEDLVDDEGNAYDALPGYTRQETWDIYNEMLEALCTPLRFGTHYGATSTNDPTFMLIHPTFDRLWHLKRLEAKEGFDETWIPDHPCYGHNPEDIMPFHNLFLEDTIGEQEHEEKDHTNGEVQIAKTYYTNQQLYKMLRPDEMDTPYVYDNFEWSHCDEQGIFIRGT